MNQDRARTCRSSASSDLFVGSKECSIPMSPCARRGEKCTVVVKLVVAQVVEVQWPCVSWGKRYDLGKH